MPPPGLRSIARPSWPARGSRLPPRDAAPPISAPSHCCIKPPWLPQLPPRPPLFMANRYPSLIPAIITIYSRYSPPFNPLRWPFLNSPPRCSGPPRAPIKGERHPGLHRTSAAHSPPLPKPVLPGCQPPSLPVVVTSPSPGRHTAARASVSHPPGSPCSPLVVAPPPASFRAPQRPEAKLR
jgi:hypothetical protein